MHACTRVDLRIYAAICNMPGARVRLEYYYIFARGPSARVRAEDPCVVFDPER